MPPLVLLAAIAEIERVLPSGSESFDNNNVEEKDTGVLMNVVNRSVLAIGSELLKLILTVPVAVPPLSSSTVYENESLSLKLMGGV